MIPVREFSSVEEMQAHARAVRERLFNRGQPAPEPAAAAPARSAVPVDERFDEQCRLYHETWKSERPTPRQIIREVARRHGLTPDDLTGQGRRKDLVLARHTAMAEIAETYPRYGLPWIAGWFGNRDHTTVLHALRKLGVRTGRMCP